MTASYSTVIATMFGKKIAKAKEANELFASENKKEKKGKRKSLDHLSNERAFT